MPSVYRRGGIYHCAFTHYNGKRVTRSTGHRVRKRALAWAIRMEDLHARLRSREISWQEFNRQTRGVVPLDGLVDEFCLSIRPGTWRRDAENIVNGFVKDRKIGDAAFFGEIGICTEAAEWLRPIRKRGLTGQRVNDYIRTLRRFGQLIWRKGLIDVNQLERLEPVKRGPVRADNRALTPAEAETLFAQANGDRWRFTVWTGLRNATVGRLLRAHLDFDDTGARLRISPEATKNGVGWMLPLAPGLADLAEQWRMLHPTIPLFPRCRREYLRTLLRRDVQAAGLAGDVNVRIFRRTNTTWLTAAGVDPHTIGTLRLDKGEGSVMLQRTHYTDPEQLVPVLRSALAKGEAWYRGELERRETG